MAFELNPFGIGMKTVSPGGMKTDFFTRSFDTGRHAAYDELVDRVMGIITDPKQLETYSTPGQIAQVVYEAATDGKDQLRYVARHRCKSDLCNASATRGRSLPQGDGSAIFRVMLVPPGLRSDAIRATMLQNLGLRSRG